MRKACVRPWGVCTAFPVPWFDYREQLMACGSQENSYPEKQNGTSQTSSGIPNPWGYPQNSHTGFFGHPTLTYHQCFFVWGSLLDGCSSTRMGEFYLGVLFRVWFSGVLMRLTFGHGWRRLSWWWLRSYQPVRTFRVCTVFVVIF